MPSIVLYYYHGSPWGAKVAAYLSLRGIQYTECHQPIGWPRPDLEALNIRYRRIPLLAIGKDVYYDTSLILAKLETLYPDNRLGATATQPTEQALEKLIEKWAAPIFPLAFHLLPTDMPLLKDSALVKDRTELWGQDFNPAGIEKGRTGSLVEMRENYAFLESLLQDGREWLLGSNTQKLGLADLHAAFLLDWLSNMGALPATFFSAKMYPHTHAWLERYRGAVAASRNQAAAPALLSGSEAASLITGSDFAEPEGAAEEDPTGLKRGQLVAVYRNDDVVSKTKHRDVGRLVTLTPREIAITIAANAAESGNELRIHCPRWQFAVDAVD